MRRSEHGRPSAAGTGAPDPTPSAPLATSLPALEDMVRHELALTGYPTKAWTLPHPAPDGTKALDVLIVGGGQAGFAAAFALRQQRIGNILVIDENPAGMEGPWNSYARMATLRTRKDTGGIEFGIPSLSVRAWYEAQFGDTWNAIEKLPTALWHGYLQWYRRMAALPVRNECCLRRFGPAANGLLEAEIEQNGTPAILWARTIVLATGIEGNGARHVPALVDRLPRDRWAHTQEAIDFSALSGRTVAVLGGGASAFDAAIAAAEHGAHTHLFHRETTLVPTSSTAWGEFNGYLAHYPELPPLDRWRFTRQMRSVKTGPPSRTIERAAALANLTRHAGCGWNAVRAADDRVFVEATDGGLTADFLILGTGYVTDIDLVAELAEHTPLMARWRDVFTPPAGEEDARLAASPFLGPNFEILEKHPGAAPWLGAVFNFSRGGGLSMGVMPIGLSGIKFGVPRLVGGVARRLFVTDAPDYLAGLAAWQATDSVLEL